MLNCVLLYGVMEETYLRVVGEGEGKHGMQAVGFGLRHGARKLTLLALSQPLLHHLGNFKSRLLYQNRHCLLKDQPCLKQ